MTNLNTTIGLFGTCGGSTWRTDFMSTYDQEGIPFFNPQVEDWDPSMAEIEADHLANDGIVLFPITGETYGTGSLSETGFSILQAINLEKDRYFVLMIDMVLDDVLQSNADLHKESMRARALVKQHLKKLSLKNVFLVDSLEEMKDVSLILHKSLLEKEKLNKYLLK